MVLFRGGKGAVGPAKEDSAVVIYLRYGKIVGHHEHSREVIHISNTIRKSDTIFIFCRFQRIKCTVGVDIVGSGQESYRFVFTVPAHPRCSSLHSSHCCQVSSPERACMRCVPRRSFDMARNACSQSLHCTLLTLLLLLQSSQLARSTPQEPDREFPSQTVTRLHYPHVKVGPYNWQYFRGKSCAKSFSTDVISVVRVL